MGEYGKVTSIREDEHTRRMRLELHDAFAPAFPQTGEMYRFAIKLLRQIAGFRPTAARITS
jgi:hypothetical protein